MAEKPTCSPSPTLVSTRPPPPHSVSTLLGANALDGIGIRADRNDPIDHDSDPSRTITMPTGSVDSPPPFSDRAATPPEPTSTPASATRPGRSLTAILNSTSHSGTDATSSAARPLD